MGSFVALIQKTKTILPKKLIPLQAGIFRSFKSFNFYLVLSFIVLLTFLTFAIHGGLKLRWFLQTEDAASFVDFLSMRTGESFLSSDFTLSPWNLLAPDGYITLSIRELCNLDYINSYEGLSNFGWHAYLISASAFLTRGLNINYVDYSLFLLSLSYAVGLLALVRYFFTKKLPLSLFLFFALVIFSSPLVMASLIGQPYLDRLAFGPLILLILRMADPRPFSRLGTIFLFTNILLLFLISERTSLMYGLAIVILTFWRRANFEFERRLQVLLYASGITMILWFLVWREFYATSAYYNLVTTQQSFLNIQTLFSDQRRPQLITLLLVLSVFLIPQMVQPKYLIFSFILIAPNLASNVGGAELVGFTTHYHSIYIPAVVACFGLSLVAIKERLPNLQNVTLRIFLAFTLIGIALSSNGYAAQRLNWVQGDLISSIEHQLGWGMYGLGAYPSSTRSEMHSRSEDIRRELKQHITSTYSSPSVSAPGGFFPTLLDIGVKDIEYFPVGVGKSKNLFVQYTSEGLPELSVYGRVAPETASAWGYCLQETINASYKEMGEFKLGGTVFKAYVRK